MPADSQNQSRCSLGREGPMLQASPHWPLLYDPSLSTIISRDPSLEEDTAQQGPQRRHGQASSADPKTSSTVTEQLCRGHKFTHKNLGRPVGVK